MILKPTTYPLISSNTFYKLDYSVPPKLCGLLSVELCSLKNCSFKFKFAQSFKTSQNFSKHHNQIMIRIKFALKFATKFTLRLLKKVISRAAAP